MSDNDGIDLECPHCEQRLRVPTFTAGTQIHCPDCGQVIEVPAKTGITEQPGLPWGQPSKAKADPFDAPARRSRDYDDDFAGDVRRRRDGAAGGSVLAPAICMLVAAIFGMLFDLLGVVLAFANDGVAADPNLPPVWQKLLEDQRGPGAAAIQAFCFLMSLTIAFGSIQMLRQKTWWLGIVVCVISIVNFGNCCCILGLPFGIWGLTSLLRSEVREAFS